jgi:hypothetical protein
MTRFVDSFATHQLMPPWKSEKSECWCFVVRLGAENVEWYLNSYFNGRYPDQAPFVYSTVRDGDQFGLIVVCRQPSIVSTLPGASKDALKHNEVYLAIPVYRRARGNPDEQPQIVWVQPFVFGDNASVLFGSREIWGMDMTLACVEFGEATPGRLHVDVAMDAIKTFSPRARSERLPCMHISTPTKGKVGLPDVGQGNPDLQSFLNLVGQGGFPVPSTPLELRVASEGVSPLTDRSVVLNNLKQFRDVYDFKAAVYRAIVASRTTHTDFDTDLIVQYKPDHVEIDFMWSDSIGEILTKLFNITAPTKDGPPKQHPDWRQDRAPLKAELAYSFTSTVDFRVIETLHTYGG